VSPNTDAKPMRRWRSLLLLALCAAALVWLFSKADSVSVEQHQEYSSKLFRLQHADAELNAAVLANRYGLHRDFDRTSAAVRRLSELIESLDEIPDFLTEADRRQLAGQLAQLRRYGVIKADAVDRFKRELSVLRNSLSYFPLITDDLIRDGVLEFPLSRKAGVFARSVMTYVLIGGALDHDRLWQTATELEAVAAELPAEQAAKLRNLLAHAALVLEHAPRIDALTHEILDLPSGATADRLMSAYSVGYGRALYGAYVYRVLLFVAALGLAGYLVVMIARQRRTAQLLARANADLNERLAALREAQSELARYATVFTNASEGMVITDAMGRILAINPAFTAITGYRFEDIEGKTPAVLSSGRQDQKFYRDMWRSLIDRGSWQGEIWNKRRSGEIYPQWLSITAVRNSDGVATHYIGIFSDVTERKRVEEHIRHLAHHDALTGLPNRLLLQDRLRQAILQAKRSGRHVAVLFFDLDRFKMINDTLGHELGDRLLRIVTERCLSAVRETDTVARQGGDEFVVVLPELQNAQDAAVIARKLLAAITQPTQLGSHDLSVTCSIGIAVYPNDGLTETDLLRNADAAMYRAKANGRNGYQFYTADMNAASLGELLLEHQLRGALERNEFRLYYQPKVDAQNGRLTGCEALLRWQHPEQGLLAPGRFVAMAEESGLIVPIGRWVIREACRQLRQWLDQGLEPVPVAVNLSAQQLAHGDLVEVVSEALQEFRLQPRLLELELTETMLMRDVSRTIETLAALHRMGVGLAIDDFGTGYSSLAYLRQFPVNSLKIDRSFVDDITAAADIQGNGRIATAVIALAHSLGLQVTAEGVQSEVQRRFLAAHGCDFLQGYLFGKPEPAVVYEQRLPAAAPREAALGK